MDKRRLLHMLPLAAVLAVALSACTVYVRPGGPAPTAVGVPLDHVITTFEPTRGNGAVYRLGDTVEFRIRTDQSGYVTLSAMDPDGRVYVFARNIYVPAYRTLILPTREMRVRFSAAPPIGFHRIRASFTSGPTDPNHVRYSGRFGTSAWIAAIDLDIRSFAVRDVAETTLMIR